MPEKKDTVDDDFVNLLETLIIDVANAHRRVDGSFDQTGQVFMRLLHNVNQSAKRIYNERADK